MFLSRPLSVISLLGVMTLLVGCAAEPSEADMKAAFDRDKAATVEQMRALFGQAGASMTTQMQGRFGVQTVRKIGCKADGDKASLCDVELEVKGLTGMQKLTRQVRFVKGSDGWVLAGQ
jgi:hypothetical protein